MPLTGPPRTRPRGGCSSLECSHESRHDRVTPLWRDAVMLATFAMLSLATDAGEVRNSLPQWRQREVGWARVPGAPTNGAGDRVREVEVDRREEWAEDKERQQRDPGGTLTRCRCLSGLASMTSSRNSTAFSGRTSRHSGS